MDFNIQLDLENLDKHSDDIIRNLRCSEAKAFKEFKTKISALFSDFFLEDSDFTKLSPFNRFETKYPFSKRIKRDHQDIVNSEMSIEEGNISDGRKSYAFSEKTESGFFEASSSSEEKSSDKRNQDGALRRRNQNKTFVTKDKVIDFGLAPSNSGDMIDFVVSPSNSNDMINFGLPSSSSDSCELEPNLETAETSFKISILRKSLRNSILEKENAIDKTKAPLDTTYIIEGRNVSTSPSTPKNILDPRLIQSKHLKYKFSYMKAVERKKQMGRNGETLMQQRGKSYLPSIKMKKQIDRNMKTKQQRRFQLAESKKQMNPDSEALIQQEKSHHGFKTNASRKINEQPRPAINHFRPKWQPLRNVFQANSHFKQDTETSNKTKPTRLKMCGNTMRNDARKKVSHSKENPKINFKPGNKNEKECSLSFKRVIPQRKCNTNPTKDKNTIPKVPEGRSNIKSFRNLGAQTNKSKKLDDRKISKKCCNEVSSKKCSAVKRDNSKSQFSNTAKCLHKIDFNKEKNSVPMKSSNTLANSCSTAKCFLKNDFQKKSSAPKKGKSMRLKTTVISWATYHESQLEEEVPAWAKGVSLKEALLRQHHCSSEFDPDNFFGTLSCTVRLEDIFGDSGYSLSRTSSANWSS